MKPIKTVNHKTKPIDLQHLGPMSHMNMLETQSPEYKILFTYHT